MFVTHVHINNFYFLKNVLTKTYLSSKVTFKNTLWESLIALFSCKLCEEQTILFRIIHIKVNLKMHLTTILVEGYARVN